MRLNSDDVARITGGKWFNLDKPITFHGVRANINFLEPGDLCIATTTEQWGKNIPNTEKQLDVIFENGAAAAIIRNPEIAKQSDKPVLLVGDTRSALTDLAFYNRDTSEVKRVVVTGAVGKTGFKNQMFRLLNHQTSVHANLDSSNLDIPILCSMASLGAEDSVEIIEISVAQPDVGVRRSNLVKPDICVITEIGFEHLETHGSFENLIKNKASIIDGLKEGGLCILNAYSKNYDLIREAIYQRKYVDIKTFGKRTKDHARLLEATFDADKLEWSVKASIEGIILDYIVPLVGEHAPMSSLIPLLVIHNMGFDVVKAAADYASIVGYETMGALSEVIAGDKKFTIYDHSQRGSVLSYSSAMQDLKRLSPRGGGRKIAILGNMLYIADQSRQAHLDLAKRINRAKIDKLYIVGKDAKCMIDQLEDKSILVQYADEYTDIVDQVLSDIRDGDLIFLKGPIKVYLSKLAKMLYGLGDRNEIR